MTFILTDLNLSIETSFILIKSLKNKLYKAKRNPPLITPDIKSIYNQFHSLENNLILDVAHTG